MAFPQERSRLAETCEPRPDQGSPGAGIRRPVPGEPEETRRGSGLAYCRRITSPARAPVSCPSARAISAFTGTRGFPSGAPSGSKMVAWPATRSCRRSPGAAIGNLVPGEPEGIAAGLRAYRRRITGPAKAPASCPSATAISAFTGTRGFPSGAPSGSKMVAWPATRSCQRSPGAAIGNLVPGEPEGIAAGLRAYRRRITGPAKAPASCPSATAISAFTGTRGISLRSAVRVEDRRVTRHPVVPALSGRGDPERQARRPRVVAAAARAYCRRITCPARAPVSSPSSTAISPFTSTQGIPSGAPSGSRMVALSTTRS